MPLVACLGLPGFLTRVFMQVTGRLKKKIAVQRADVKLKERQALRQLTDHQKQLSQMHSAEEMEQLAGRVQEMEKAALKAKGEISRLRLHIKASQVHL